MEKTEKEKMLAGEIYDCGDPELQARWHLAKRLTLQYNQADTRDREYLDGILEKLLGSRGKNVWIAPPFYVDYGENIHIGEGCEINMNCVFLDCNTIIIGNYSGIGPNVQIYAVTHPVIPEERLSGKGHFWKSSTAPVVIGDNVWIGGGTIILAGVTIGSGTTVAAGSVVTRSLPERCLAAGTPCKVIRYL